MLTSAGTDLDRASASAAADRAAPAASAPAADALRSDRKVRVRFVAG
jgi:hypothetical protein